MKKIICLIAILGAAITASAQRGGGMMMMGGGAGMAPNPIMLLSREDVQEELALTSEQKEKLIEFTDQRAMMQRGMKMFQDSGMSFEDMRTEEGRKKLAPMMEKMQEQIRKEVEAVLTPAQGKRLLEINIQMAGNRAIMMKEVAKALTITEDQNKKVEALLKASGDASRALFEKMRNQELDREAFQEKTKKNSEILDVELGKILTEGQRAKLVELGGKKFTPKEN